MELDDNTIDARLPYRVGYPTLPTLPILTEDADISEHVHDAGQFFAEIRTILSDLNIPIQGIRSSYCYHEGHTQRDKITLRVLSEYEENCQSRWIQAVKAIYAKLYNDNLPFAIEICHWIVGNRGFWPVPLDLADTKMRNAVEELEPVLHEEINGHLWLTVDILSWPSVIHDERRPTFVISASDSDSDSWWSVTLPSIQRKFSETEHGFEVVLLHLEKLRFSTTGDSSGVEQPNQELAKVFYSEPRTMGTSCGLKGSEHSGTWGGKVVLRKDGKDLELGLTNCHVLLNEILQVQKSGGESASFLRGNKGPFIPGAFTKDHIVVSPSDQDHIMATKNLKAEIIEKKKILKDLAEIASFKDLTRWQQHEREQCQSQEPILAKALRFAEYSNREMGIIFAASGYTKATFKPTINWPTQDWALDWALFEINADHCQADISGLLMRWNPVEPYTQYKVTKKSRTSGKTDCYIAGFKSKLQWRSDEPHELDVKKPNIITEELMEQYPGVSTTHAVVSQSGNYRGEVLLKGDSGSLILQDQENSSPRVLGLGFAANPGTRISYMMPAELLVRSIEEVTGWKVQGFINY